MNLEVFKSLWVVHEKPFILNLLKAEIKIKLTNNEIE